MYELIRSARTVGLFQLESSGQRNLATRLQQRDFEDVIAAISLFRPGPLQADMIAPFIRRRHGLEPVTVPHPDMEPVLRRTYGVIVYQEQVIEVAAKIAGFSLAEGDMLRRAMTHERSMEEMDEIGRTFVEKAVARGVARSAAEEVFRQLRGFAAYGFNKAHAACFAIVCNASAWLKAHYPAEFYCGLLNNQPMGFYSPRVVLNDARRWGLEVLPVDVNLQRRVVRGRGRRHGAARRARLRQGDERRGAAGDRRGTRGRRGRASGGALRGPGGQGRCGRGGALRGPLRCLRPLPSLFRPPVGPLPALRGPAVPQAAGDPPGPSRPTARSPTSSPAPASAARSPRTSCASAPSTRSACAARSSCRRCRCSTPARARRGAGAAPARRERPPAGALAPAASGLDQPRLVLDEQLGALDFLPSWTLEQRVRAELEVLGLNVSAHPLRFVRDQVEALGVTPFARLAQVRHGRRVRLAGVLERAQMPWIRSGHRTMFLTLEDETELAQVVVFNDVYLKYGRVLKSAIYLYVEGELQNDEEHGLAVVAHRIADLLAVVGRAEGAPVGAVRREAAEARRRLGAAPRSQPQTRPGRTG